MAAKKKSRRGAGSAASKKKAKPSRGSKGGAKPRVTPPSQQGPEPARLQAALRESIERDIAARIEAHQREVARIRLSVRRGGPSPLMLLAHGDSWFNYPLNGNSFSLSDTDIVAHLTKMGSPPPKILNISHYGDATTDEMGLHKQERLIAALRNPKNWLTGKPDAILFSGGGNDIAGDPFCIYLNYKDSNTPGLDRDRFAGRLASIRSSYLDLFLFRTRYADKVPIFGHCYDFARPMQPHPPCVGPWISPSLTFTGWSTEEGAQIIHDALELFKGMVDELERSRQYDFTVVQTQNTLAKSDWANELHPHPPGFKKLAEKFLDALRLRFGDRI
jgi:hypothetical protein